MEILKCVVDSLQVDANLITDTLSLGGTKFMGVCKYPGDKSKFVYNFFPNTNSTKIYTQFKLFHSKFFYSTFLLELPFRRLDIRLLPFDQYHCGILYFTGSDQFNKMMRAHALDQGFTLNEYSLRPIDKGNSTQKIDISNGRFKS